MIRVEVKVLFEHEDLMEDFCWQWEAVAVDREPNHLAKAGSIRKVGALLIDLDLEAFSSKTFSFFPEGSVISIHTEEVQEEAWQESWRKNFQAFSVGHMNIVPEWEDVEPDRNNLIVYPGQAFGTGQHETTRLMLKGIQKIELQDKSVLDIGCGTGILAIAAEKRGAASVFGFDNDPDCRENMDRHLKNNHATRTRLEIGCFEQFHLQQVDVVFMNITLNVLVDLWPLVPKVLKPNGVVLSSGILREQVDDARKHLRTYGFQIIDEDFLGEWCMLLCRHQT